jgi:integrase
VPGEPRTGKRSRGAIDKPPSGNLRVRRRDPRLLLHRAAPVPSPLQRPRQHSTRSPKAHLRQRCTPHRCRPLAASGIRQIHSILSGACSRAVRWKWVSINPVQLAEPPAAPKPKPNPPTAEEAARILNEAWKDADWGTLIWLAMTTGARRGEQCGLRWRHVDLDQSVLYVSPGHWSTRRRDLGEGHQGPSTAPRGPGPRDHRRPYGTSRTLPKTLRSARHRPGWGDVRVLPSA